MADNTDTILLIGVLAVGGYIAYKVLNSGVFTGAETAVQGAGQGFSTAAQGIGEGLSTAGQAAGQGFQIFVPQAAQSGADILRAAAVGATGAGQGFSTAFGPQGIGGGLANAGYGVGTGIGATGLSVGNFATSLLGGIGSPFNSMQQIVDTSTSRFLSATGIISNQLMAGERKAAQLLAGLALNQWNNSGGQPQQPQPIALNSALAAAPAASKTITVQKPTVVSSGGATYINGLGYSVAPQNVARMTSQVSNAYANAAYASSHY